MSDQKHPLSCYEEISQLNKGHRVSIVRHRETGKIYVKKILSVYSLAVYSALYERPVKHTPRICALCEDRGTLTVIEEYISGDSLDEILEKRGPLPEQETIRIAVMLCRILEELHSFDPPLIHRDIKPSNILMTEAGEIVLLDMNAAKFMDADKAADTRLLGTPGFAAPEQFGFGSSTTATDLYAVGVLMDTLLSGTSPAAGDRGTGLTPGSHIPGSHIPGSQADPRLRQIIGKCRELDPKRRYSSASDLARDLSELLRESSSGYGGSLSDGSSSKDRSRSGSKDRSGSGSEDRSRSGSRLQNSVSQNDPLFSHRNGGNNKKHPVLPVLAGGAAVLLLLAVSLFRPKPPAETPVPAVSAETQTSAVPAETQTSAAQSEASTASAEAEAAPASSAAETAPAQADSTQAEISTAQADSTQAEISTAQASSAHSEEAPAELFGSWKGETNGGLTIDPDGTAVYYNEQGVFSEPADPWIYADGRISITLSKLHCVITADTKDGFSELVFKSDSGNWDDERFVKLPQEDPEYRQGALRAFDEAITVLPDGRMEMTFGGLKFTVPKHYLNYPDAFSSDKNVVLLSDVNVDTMFIGCAAFQYMDFDALSILDTSMTFPGFAKEFLYSFFYDVRLSDVKEETIAGTRAFTARFTGETNKGFSGVTGLPSEGIVAFFCDDARGKVVKIVLMQHSESSEDAMPEMEEIIYGVSAL